jgi:hypothetical protein
MIDGAVHDLLLESAQKALETMFFASPDTVSTEPRRPAGELIAASLTFQGTPPGRFGLIVSDLFARTLAANFIGCDDPASLLPAQVAGVMGELANMMCGAVLSEMESDVNFDLSAPESIHVGADEPGPDFSAGSPSICRFEFSEGALVSFLMFKEPV